MPPVVPLPLAVKLHRQDALNYCGAACIQMIRQFEGADIGVLDQVELMKDSKNDLGTPLECLDLFRWGTCPHSLAAGLNPTATIEYVEKNSDQTPDELIQLIAYGLTQHGKPSVMLVDSGLHWMVVHGVREDAVTGICFDVRDPWPPEVKAEEHEEEPDDGEDEGVASSHLIFPAGLQWHFNRADPRQPDDNPSQWKNHYVAIVPKSAADEWPEEVLPQEALPPLEEDGPLPAALVNEQDAEQSALDAFAAASSLGWEPAVGESVIAGFTVHLNLVQNSPVNALHSQSNYIVELHRDDDSGYVVAMALVAAAGLFGGQTLELLAPAKGKSWLRQAAELRAFVSKRRELLRQTILRPPSLLQSGPENLPAPSVVKAARIAGSLMALQKWPKSLEEVPESLRWLLDQDQEQEETEYVWTSTDESRSPFHPFIRIKKGAREALLMPNGQFRRLSDIARDLTGIARDLKRQKL